MTEWYERLRKRWGQGGKNVGRYLLVGLGVLGMVLIALTEWLPHRDAPADAAIEAVSAAQVEQALEQRIASLLSEVEGVGRCRVMVTLENDEQAVYAADTAYSATGESSSSSENYLTVDTENGPVGLLLTRIRPTVKGVAVVCRGADDPRVCQRVQTVITTAFHISERRVCVVQQK